MPDQPVLVYEKDSGQPVFMHSIDAAEAVRLGDYTLAPPGEPPPPEAMAQARARLTGVNVNPHPELMTEEQRAQVRAEAAAEAQANPPAEESLGVRRALGASITTPPPSRPPASPTPESHGEPAAPSTEPSSSTRRRSGD